MSKVLVSSLLSLSQRSYSVVTESTDAVQVAATRATAATETATMEPVGSAKKEIFWMRDPKTGYWIPENRFNEVDAVDLRARLLPKKY